jgi:hypothetical protein
MAAAPIATCLHGLRVSVADSAGAAAWLHRLLPAPLARDENVRWPRLGFASRWLELRTGSGDTLELHCAELARQRTHLQRLGIEPADSAVAGCTPRLRLDTMDTGACTVDLRERTAHKAGPDDAPQPDAPGAATAVLCGLELAVRSPERIALHWAQLFHSRATRAAGGLPALSLEGFDLRFALAADGRARVSAIDFAVPDVAALATRALSQGLEPAAQREGHAGFDAHGIRANLRQAD